MTTPGAIHHIDNYGADPAGQKPSDNALDAAIVAADDGDRISLAGGTYYLARDHEIRKELVVVATGGVIESDYHPGYGYDDGYPREGATDGTQLESLAPILAFRGERGDCVSLADTVLEGSDQVTVTDGGRFSVGGGILLCNEDLDADRVIGTVANRTRGYEPTVSTVRAIDGDTIFLDVPARYNYSADEDHHVYPLSFLDQTGFVDCHFRNRNELTWDPERGKVMGGFRHAMLHQYCRAPVVRNCSVRGYDTKMWVPIDVLEAEVINPRAEAPMNINGSHGEPIYILGSTNVTIYNPVIRGARRAIDVRAGCKDVTVYNPDISGVSFLGLSYHHGHGVPVRGNLNVYGGRVACKPTDPTQDDHGGRAGRRWEFQRGDGMRDTPASGRVRVSGTSFLVRRRGADLAGSGTVIENCEFETVPHGGTSDPILAISGSDVVVRNTRIDAGTGRVAAVRIVDASNVECDIRIEGAFDSAPVLVNGGRRLRLRARITSASGPGIRLGGTVSDLDLQGDLYNDGSGVVIGAGANADHLRIREFTHRGDGPTVAVDSAASVRGLRLAGLASLHEGDLDLAGNVDGLRIANVACGEVRRPSTDRRNDGVDDSPG